MPPLFPELPLYPSYYEQDLSAIWDDPFVAELVLTEPFQRLRHIGFLGAIDYVLLSNGRQPHRRRHTRYDHSLGVAALALLYADIKGLSRRDARVLAAAGLLHDIGHGPLSHTLEPVFKQYFGIAHHKAGEEIIYGRSPFGKQIATHMRDYDVDVDEVVAMIDGTHQGPHAFLFSSPINLDTIEGITRSRVFVAKTGPALDPRKLVAGIAHSVAPPTALMDEFWRLKNVVYNLVIHNKIGLVFDGLAQAYMVYNISNFSQRDFFKTEEQLRSKEPTLFHLFAWTRTSRKRTLHRLAEVIPGALEFELHAPRRTFTINNVPLCSMRDLPRRYTQQKEHRAMTIGGILADA